MSIQKKLNKLYKSMSKKDAVSESELRNLQLRAQLLQTKQLEKAVVENEYRQYINMLLEVHSKDPEKAYNIHLETGEIEEKITPEKA